MTELDISTNSRNIQDLALESLVRIKQEPSMALEALDILRRRKEIVDEMEHLEAPVRTAQQAYEAAKKEYDAGMEQPLMRLTQIDTELNALMERL